MKVLKVEGLSAMEAFNQNDQSNIVLRTKELSAKVPPAPQKKNRDSSPEDVGGAPRCGRRGSRSRCSCS